MPPTALPNPTTALTRTAAPTTPEQLELERKQSELTELESRLAQRELDLALLRDEIDAFRKTYVARLGPALAELAEVEAQIEEALARLRPHDPKQQASAQQARQQADAAQSAVDDEPQAPDFQKQPPNESLKKLYRDAAKMMHPDLAADEADRKLRTRMMAELNAAFAAGDASRIEHLIKDWSARPEAVPGDGLAAQLIRTIRKIAQVETRLAAITAEIDALLTGEWNELKVQADDFARAGKNFYQAMEEGIQERIGDAKTRFNQLPHAA